MPGRLSTGPLISAAAKPKRRKPKRALDALAIAEKENPRKNQIRQARLGELEDRGPKRRRETLDDEDDGDDEHGATAPKRARRGDKDYFGNEIEVGSDSSGNEWVIGQVGEENDSDLDSDEAFGDSDEEKFEAFSFGRREEKGSKRERQNGIGQEEGANGEFAGFDMDEEDEYDKGNDEESDGFAEDAVDLAGVLDDDGSGSGDSDGSDDDSGFSEDESALSFSGDEDDSGDKEKLASLQALVSTMNEQDQSAPRPRAPIDAQESATPSEFGVNSKRKLTVADLVPSVTDPGLRKSLKMLADDDNKSSNKRGIAKKLDTPLPQRQQDRLNRATAGDKSKETLNRWIDTVKHNRRAEHLSFPLQNPNAVAPPGSKRLLNNDQTQPVTELEKTIQNILKESGLTPASGRSQEDQIQEFEELAANKMPLAEVQARRAELRRMRELLFREEIRAKRIKKIKSKSFRKVHRKERERNAQQEKIILAEAGVEESEGEKERNDRRRAEERMGARHRESKWAKGIRDSGRARWDEDARGGVTEMARREEELRRRIAGKEVDGSDDSSIDDAEDVNEDEGESERLPARLRELEAGRDADTDAEGLAGMKFMKRAEAARKARNDDDAERLRRDLAGEETPSGDETVEGAGRRSYGPTKGLGNARPDNPLSTAVQSEFEEKPGLNTEEDLAFQGFEDDTEIITDTPRVPGIALSDKYRSTNNPKPPKQPPNSTLSDNVASNPWLSTTKNLANHSRKRREDNNAGAIISNTLPPPSEPPASAASHSKSRAALKDARKPEQAQEDAPGAVDPVQASNHASNREDASANSDNDTDENPLLPSNASLIHRAFAGDSVLASFSAEKEATAASSAPQVISTALPGWGSWTGPGISKKELRRSKARQKSSAITTPGIDPSKRKDAKMERVIINQGRVKKNAKYLAKELPFPFETAQQYERSLRLPVGGEWTTKETFQNMTKPRILRKQGVVHAIETPVV